LDIKKLSRSAPQALFRKGERPPGNTIGFTG